MHSHGRVKRALTSIAVVMTAALPPALGLGPPAGASAPPASDTQIRALPNLRTVQTGYWVVDRRGGVAAGGGAPSLGGLGHAERLAGPVVGLAASAGGRGYWLVTAGGRVFGFGRAARLGRASGAQVRRLGRVVSIAATRDGKGYWLLTRGGAVLNFGDARRFGPLRPGQLRMAEGTLSSLVATPEGGGYWVVAANGRVFCFGDARCFGAHPGATAPIVGLASTADGNGYWLATTTGRVLAFGDAPGRGRLNPDARRAPVVGIAAPHGGHGYWLADATGATFGFGTAAATGAARLARGVVAIEPDPAPVVPARAVAAGRGARLEASTAASPGPGQTAVHFALDQVGKPYVWGGTGPSGFDCSGLAMMAWRSAGVDLPRTAAAQYYAGPHVPLSQLQPGDLVFWASNPSDPSTIYHVAISLGGTETVQATHSGSTVKVMALAVEGGAVPLATVP
jgi:cell wall-associated NlpC family hydrolase